MSVKNLKELKALIEGVGGTFSADDTGRHTMVNVDAPDGHVWSASGCHCLCTSWWGTIDRPQWKQEKQDGMNDVAERVAMGVEICDDPECDVCEGSNV
jgi:hypothetical protein